MASLPPYADKDLVATALLMGGMSPDDVATRFQRSQDNPQAVLDALANADDSGLKKLAKLVVGYVANPGTGHLTDLLKNAGVDDNIVGQAISNVQGPNPNQTAPTPPALQVLASINQLGGGNLLDTVNSGLQKTGAGQTGLTTTREQYLFGPPPTPAPAGPAAPPTPNAAPSAGGPPPSPQTHTQSPGIKAAAAPAPGGGPPPAAPAPAGGQAAPGGGGGPNNQPPPPATWNDDQIKSFVKSNFGANAYFIDIPEVWNALKDVVKSGKGINGLEPALEQTNFWKQQNVAARSWYVKERADPAQAAADVAQQGQAIQSMADQAGVTIDPTRVQEMAQSYLRYGWTQTDLQRAVSAEWHYDPNSKNQAAAVTKMKQDARNWLVPLSDQAIQTWGQGLMSGTTTDAQYQQYLRDNAKSLLPQLSTLIDAHQNDPTFTVDHFVDPYRTSAANLLGIQPDQIDFMDPKWRRALDQVDPKTNMRRIMSLSEWDSTLKTDPSYGYDKTANGIKDGLNLATQLKASMGF